VTKPTMPITLAEFEQALTALAAEMDAAEAVVNAVRHWRNYEFDSLDEWAGRDAQLMDALAAYDKARESSRNAG